MSVMHVLEYTLLAPPVVVSALWLVPLSVLQTWILPSLNSASRSLTARNKFSFELFQRKHFTHYL